MQPQRKWYRDVYLRSLQWKQTRTEYMRRVGWRCENCHVRQARLVHHLDYSKLGYEQPQDLMALCHECHDKMHRWPRQAQNDNNQLKLLFEKLEAG